MEYGNVTGGSAHHWRRFFLTSVRFGRRPNTAVCRLIRASSSSPRALMFSCATSNEVLVTHKTYAQSTTDYRPPILITHEQTHTVTTDGRRPHGTHTAGFDVLQRRSRTRRDRNRLEVLKPVSNR